MQFAYLDNSATTVVCPQAAQKAYDVMVNNYGNPSSLHTMGINAERELTQARNTIAGKLGVREDEIFFTSGGTEANNTAIFGAAYARRRMGNRIVTTPIEHSSVYDSIKQLEKEGLEVVYLPVDKYGQVDRAGISEAINSDTILVSIMAVNNELGTIEPYSAAASVIKRVKAPALLHVDAVQAFGKLNLRPAYEGVDLMSISAHKIHGPKGVGALYIKKGTRILPRVYGGEQEKKIRPGTQSVPLIAAFSEAVKALENTDYAPLYNYLKERLSEFDNVVINSPENGLKCILNFSVKGYRSETMLHHLASKGVYVSSGSACALGKPSHVLTAVGIPRELADSALRVSFSRYNTKEDIDLLIEAINSGINSIATA